MKKSLPAILAVAISCFAILGKAQTVFQPKYISEADVKVYVTQDSTTADLLVYSAPAASAASSNTGIWFFSTAPGPGVKKVFFVDAPGDADFSIYITHASHRAGWRNNAKSFLMN